MSYTNFAALTSEALTMWQRDVWKQARNEQFLNRFTGTTSKSMIQRITELTKSNKGARAVMTLVSDLEGDGVAGDRTLRGNEEAMRAGDQVIRVDQLRHANVHEGRMADQKSVVNFRENSRDVLAHWLADRWDQMAFLTLAGVSYTLNTDGSTRVGSDLPNLEFAADVTAPSTNRHRRWDATAGALVAGNTAAVTATDLPSYKMLVAIRSFLKRQLMKPIRGENGKAVFNVFMCPEALARLKMDADFIANVRSTQERMKDSPLFMGYEDAIMVDGLAIFDYNHVYNTSGTATKWGAGTNVNGCRISVCGAQALGVADIGQPIWVEEGFDYENQQGISVGKISGFKKPVFRSNVTRTNEDFGVLNVDVAF